MTDYRYDKNTPSDTYILSVFEISNSKTRG